MSESVHFICFKWGLIDDIDQQRVHPFHWQFQMGGISEECHLKIRRSFHVYYTKDLNICILLYLAVGVVVYKASLLD